jgi:hypothetical protein
MSFEQTKFKEANGIFWQLNSLVTGHKKPIERIMTPDELFDEMSEAQRRLRENSLVIYNGTALRWDFFASHYGVETLICFANDIVRF